MVFVTRKPMKSKLLKNKELAKQWNTGIHLGWTFQAAKQPAYFYWNVNTQILHITIYLMQRKWKFLLDVIR